MVAGDSVARPTDATCADRQQCDLTPCPAFTTGLVHPSSDSPGMLGSQRKQIPVSEMATLSAWTMFGFVCWDPDHLVAP